MAGPLRIALILHQYNAFGGGAERWTHDHAVRLIERGNNVHIYARAIKGAPANARTHIVDVGSLGGMRRLRFAEQVESLLRAEKFDIAHDMGDSWHADIIMPHHGARRYVYQQRSRTSHGLLRWARPLGFALLPRYREFRKMEALQYKKGSEPIIVAVSEMVRRQLLSTYSIDPQRVIVIRNGVDLERFRPDETGRNRDRIRSEMKWQSRTIYLTVAHDFKLKGVDRIVAAMAHLRGRGRDAGLIVIGSGNIPKYEQMARQMGVGNDVIFMGDQEDPVPYYHASDVFVLPTLYDPCPLVVMEALACGLPVITTSYNGATELMTLPRDGVVLNDPMNVMELALAMLRFDEAETARLAPERAAASRRPELCAKQMFDKHLHLYEQILRERGALRSAAAASEVRLQV